MNTLLIGLLGILLVGASGCASTAVAPSRGDTVATTQRRARLSEGAERTRRPLHHPQQVHLVAGGDVIYGRYLKRGLRRAGGPTPFAAIAPRLRAADVSILNLETPLTDVEPVIRPNAYGKWLKFRGPTAFAATLAESGVDVAILANNHAEDCGAQGVSDTIRSLTEAGVAHLGTSAEGGDPFSPIRLPVDDAEVLMIAATAKRNRGTPRPGAWIPVAYGTIAQLTQWLPAKVRALRAAHPDATIVVSLHWGAGFEHRIHSGQVRLGHAVIDAGADLILGHHAHILQAVEQYGEGLIIYGMGNLVFDMRDRRGRETALFEVTLTERDGRLRADALTVVPLLIADLNSGPAPVSEDRAEAILAPVMRPAGERFATPMTLDGGVARWRWTPRD